MRSAFKDVNRPKLQRKKSYIPRNETPREKSVMQDSPYKSKLTELIDKQKEHLIEVKRKSSSSPSPNLLEKDLSKQNSDLSLESIDKNIEEITAGLKILTKKVSQDVNKRVIEPIPPIKPLTRTTSRSSNLSRKPVTGPPIIKKK